MHDTDTGLFFPNMALARYDNADGDSGAPIICHNSTGSEIVGSHKGKICKFEPSPAGVVDVCNSFPAHYKVFSAWENVKHALNLD